MEVFLGIFLLLLLGYGAVGLGMFISDRLGKHGGRRRKDARPVGYGPYRIIVTWHGTTWYGREIQRVVLDISNPIKREILLEAERWHPPYVVSLYFPADEWGS